MVDLFVGVDIGKKTHAAALISTPLLKHHGMYTSCPTFPFPNTRPGFEKLLIAMKVHVPSMKRVHVVLERTGHYGMALEQYLMEQGCILYRVQAQKRYGQEKTDKRDAQALAVRLYNQIGLGTPIVDRKEAVQQLIPPAPAALMLRGLVRHRAELTRECVRRENKLTAICDELFPEFTDIYASPNSASALLMREQYPTPADIANAKHADLVSAQLHTFPGRVRLARLQELARSTIGTKDGYRRRALVLEQGQLIKEWRLHQEHISELDKEIESILTESREGQILRSFPGIGNVQAAILLSGIGSIANFSTVGKLRLSLGWGVRRSQTGTTFDSTRQDKGGNKLLKTTMYLVALTAVGTEPWKTIYQRRVERTCAYDAKKGEYVGKNKALGHIAGKIISIIYLLLKRDHELVSSTPPGIEMPPPELYDPEKHRASLR